MRCLGPALLLLLADCGEGERKQPTGPVVLCRGVDQRRDPAAARFAEQTIGAHLFRDPALIHVDRLMRQERWTVAWSSPAGIGESVYLLRRNGPIIELAASGRTSEARTRPQVAAWAMGVERHRPEPMPATLAWCLARALVR